MQRFLILFVFGFFLFNSAQAQQDLEVEFSAAASVAPGGTVTIDVSVNNFDNLISAQFSINWDATAMSFNSITNVTNDLVDFLPGNIGTVDNSQGVMDGQLRVSWSPTNGSDLTNGVSIPDGTVLFSFLLNGDGAPCDEVDLVLSNVPLSIEVADNNLNVFSAITSGANIFVEGPDCNDPGTGGGDGCPVVGNTSNVGYLAPEITAEMGANICIPITVNNWADIQSAQSGITWNPAVLTFTGSQNYNLDGLNASSLNANNAANGEIRFIWFDNTGSTPSTLPNGSTIFELCFDVIGANGTSSDILFTNIAPSFNIEIADSNQQLLPFFTDCGEVTVGDGVDPTGPDGCDPSGDFNGVGLLTVEMSVVKDDNICIPITVENFNDIQSAQSGMAWDPTLFSFTGTQSYNPLFTGLNANSFNVANAANGQLRFIWFDNTGVSPVTLPDGTAIFEICFDIVGDCDDFGDIVFQGFTNFNIEFSNSNGQTLPFFTDCGELAIACDVLPEDVTLIVEEVTGNTGEEVCLNVSATEFNDLSSMQFNLIWDDNFLSYSNPNISCLNPNMGINVANFNYLPTEKIRLSWTSSTGGVTLNNGAESVLFCVCFDVVQCDVTGATSSTVEIVGDSMVAIEISNSSNQEVGFILNQGSITVNASESCGPVITGTSVTDATCFGGVGSIDATVVGANSCEWFLAGTSTSVSNMCDLIAAAGSYTLIATDAQGNTTSATATINQPTQVTGSAESTDESCTEGGSIILAASGGTGNLVVTWTGSPSCTNGCTGTTLSGLGAGAYTYTITDVLGCTGTGVVQVNGSTDIPIVTAETTPVDCDNLGTITLTSNKTNVNVTWVPVEAGTGLEITNLPTGTYSYTVTDPATNCSVMGSVEVVDNFQEFVVTETVNDIICFQDDLGSIDFNISGGCPNYSITVNFAGATIIGSSIQNLPPGIYEVSVLDSSEPANVVLKMITIDGPSAALSFVSDGATSSTGSDGTISTTVTGGTPPYSYSWSGATCDTGCPDNGDLTGLAAGTYVATVTDANKCTETLQVIVPVEGVLTITNVNILSEDDNNGFGVSCAGLAGTFCDGLIDVEIAGATATLDISILDGSGATVGTYTSFPIDGLCAGSYTITVTDGTSTDMQTFEISEPDPIIIQVAQVITDLPGSIDLDVSGGTGDYTYLWNAPLDATTQDVFDLDLGTYSVFVTDENNCTALSSNITIDGGVTGIPCYTAVPIITPNGDGINDIMTIQCSTNNPSSISIYDRWGRLVYQEAIYSNNWGGTDASGELLTEGAYYWVLQVAFSNGDSRLFKGTVTLLRE